MELQQRIADRIGEFLIFAVTPPRLTTGSEQTRQIAEVTLARLGSVGSTASVDMCEMKLDRRM